jgi:hypothetical protein
MVPPSNAQTLPSLIRIERPLLMPFRRTSPIFLPLIAVIILNFPFPAHAQIWVTSGFTPGSTAGQVNAYCSTSADNPATGVTTQTASDYDVFLADCTVTGSDGTTFTNDTQCQPFSSDSIEDNLSYAGNPTGICQIPVQVIPGVIYTINSLHWIWLIDNGWANVCGDPTNTCSEDPEGYVRAVPPPTPPAYPSTASVNTHEMIGSGVVQYFSYNVFGGAYPLATSTALFCPTPTITSISPNVWFAGETYNNVTITGTGFTPVSQGLGKQTCPATTVTVTTPSGAAVALGTVTVNNSTKITIASVKPPVLEPSETATVTASGGLTATYTAQIENPQPSIKTLQYTNSLPVWLDGPSNATPVAMSQTVWPASTPSVRSVFVSSTSINATATFNVTPITVALSGARIEANMTGAGLMFAQDVSIPAGATSIQVTLTSEPLPDNKTQHYQPLGLTWSFSPSGQSCSSGTSVCEPAGSTSSEVFVTLATPLPMSESVMPLSAVELAIGSGGATSPTQAIQNAWQQFALPANVSGWDGRSFIYYPAGTPFQGCATSALLLLTTPTGGARCGAFAQFFQDVLAVNGISSVETVVTPTVDLFMLVKNWSFSTTTTFTNSPPWDWSLVTSSANEMVPPPDPATPTVYGAMTSDIGVPGQNSPTPSEKIHVNHAIVCIPSTGVFYDPSYGLTYTGASDFENQALNGYASHFKGDPANQFRVRNSSGLNLATFTPGTCTQ